MSQNLRFATAAVLFAGLVTLLECVIGYVLPGLAVHDVGAVFGTGVSCYFFGQCNVRDAQAQ